MYIYISTDECGSMGIRQSTIYIKKECELTNNLYDCISIVANGFPLTMKAKLVNSLRMRYCVSKWKLVWGFESNVWYGAGCEVGQEVLGG